MSFGLNPIKSNLLMLLGFAMLINLHHGFYDGLFVQEGVNNDATLLVSDWLCRSVLRHTAIKSN